MNTTNGIRKKYTLPLRLAIGVLLMGALFKIQHWPLADALLIIGVTAVVVLYVPRYLAKPERRFMDHVKLLLVLSWPTGYLFSVMHWPYASVFSYVAAPLFLIWIFKSGIGEFWNDSAATTPSTWSIVLFVGGLGLVGMGTLFRIEHWPYGGAMLIAGFALCAAWFVYEFFPRLRTGRDDAEAPSVGSNEEKGA